MSLLLSTYDSSGKDQTDMLLEDRPLKEETLNALLMVLSDLVA